MIHYNIYTWIDASLLAYFLLLNGFYVFILLLGFPVLFKRAHEANSEDINQLLNSDHLPPISIIIAAHNEKDIINESIASIFLLDYPHYELIVANDGSDDGTLEALIEKYEMVPVPPALPILLETAPVLGYYRSQKHPNFLLINKEKGGQEDAVNAGINASTSPYFLATDADVIVEPDVLRRLAFPLLTRHNTIGLGGALRVANGCRIENGEVKEVHLAKGFLARMQTLEYLRGFFFGRIGWNVLGGPFVLPGAFGLLSKQAVLDTGGYGRNIPAADIDLTWRMHRKMYEMKKSYNIEYVPDAVIWTEVPNKYGDLARQRKRWHCSVFDVYWKNRELTFNPRYGRVAFVYLPYFVLGEGLGPLIEGFAYLYVTFCWIVGVLNLHFVWMFILISWGFSFLLSFISLAMEQVTFKKRMSLKDIFTLVGYTLIENIGYRQLSVWWRVQGFFRVFTKNRLYREHPTRHGFKG